MWYITQQYLLVIFCIGQKLWQRPVQVNVWFQRVERKRVRPNQDNISVLFEEKDVTDYPQLASL